MDKNAFKIINIRRMIFLFIIALVVITSISMLCDGLWLTDSNGVYLSGNQIVGYYNELWEAVHNGRILFFSNKFGSGYDFTAVITYYLSDVLNFIILLFPKAQIGLVLNIIYILKCSLSSVTLYVFLDNHYIAVTNNEKKQSEKVDNRADNVVKLLISLFYSIAVLGITLSVNPLFVIGAVMFPLVIAGLEKLVYNSEGKLYAVTTAVLLVSTFQLGVAGLIFSSLYLLVMEYRDKCHVIRTVCVKLFIDILIIPVAFISVYTNITSRFFSDEYSISFPYSKNFHDIYATILNLMKPELGFIALPLFCTLLYLFLKNVKFWKKLRVAMILILMLLATYNTTANFVMNAFNNRLLGSDSFVIFNLLLFLVIAYEVLMQLKRFSRIQIFISLSVFILIFGFSFLKNDEESKMNLDKSDINACIEKIRQIDSNSGIYVYDAGKDYPNPVVNAILGNGYVIVTGDNLSVDIDSRLTYYDAYKEMIIYKSGFQNKNAYLLDASYPVYSDDNPYTSLNKMAECLTGIDDIFYPVEGDSRFKPNPYDPTNINTMAVEFSFPEEGEYYTNLDNLIYAGKLKEGEASSIICYGTIDDISHKVAVRESVAFDNEKYDRFIDALAGNKCEITFGENEIIVDMPNNAVAENAEISGTDEISTKESNNTYIIVPYDLSTCFTYPEGVEVYYEKICGQVVTVLGGNIYGKLNLKYYPYNAIKGAVVSLISLLIIAVLYMLVSRCGIKNLKGYDVFARKLASYIDENRAYIYTIFICSVLCVVFFITKQCVPFGEQSAVISDGYVSSYPSIYMIIQNIKKGVFSYLDTSLGYARLIQNYNFIFTNPLKLLMFLFPEDRFILGYNLYYAAEFVLTGPAMIFYLTHRLNGNRMDKREIKLVPIALAYSLSSYVMCYYTFYSFLDLVIILPFVILCLERLVYEKKYLLYSFILAFYMMNNFYYAFLLCEFVFLYFLTMDHGNLKSFIRNSVRFGISSICSACIAAYVIFPAARLSFNSGYVDTDNRAKQNIDYFSHSILESIKALKPDYDMIRVTEDWTNANTYCGLLVVLSLILYALNGKLSLASRIKRLCLMGVMFLAYSNQFLNYVFHGFHFQSFVPNRFSLFFIFMMIQSFYDVILYYKELYRKKNMLAFSVFAVVILLSIISAERYTLSGYMVSAFFILAYIMLFFAGYHLKKPYKATVGLLFVLGIELIASLTFSMRQTLSYSGVSPQTAAVMKRMSDNYNMKDNPFIRTEIVNESNYNMACLINTNSASIFTSILQREQINLLDYWNVYCEDNNNVEYLYGNPLANIMLGERYFFYDKDHFNPNIPHYFEELDNEEMVTLYTDPNVSGKSLLINTDSLKIKSGKNPFEQQNDISNQLVGASIYDNIDAVVSVSQSGGNGEYSVCADIPEGIVGDIYIEHNNYIQYLGYTDGSEEKSFYKNVNIDPGLLEETNSVYVPDKADESMLKEYADSHISVATVNTNVLEQLKGALSEYAVTKAEAGADYLSIEADIKEPGDYYVPIPDYQEWHIQIDGIEVHRGNEYKSEMGGMMIKLPVGKHIIKMEYKKPGITLYYIISVISAIGISVTAFLMKHKDKHSTFSLVG